jgi:hypothetical protein
MAAKPTAIASSGRELYHLQFSLQTSSPETFGYTLVCPNYYHPKIKNCIKHFKEE